MQLRTMTSTGPSEPRPRASIVVTAMVVLMLVATSPALADRLIPFQARLSDAAGAPVADGLYDITFSVYDQPLGGVALVGETHNGISVIGGQVNLLLGAINSLDAIDFTVPRYLGITVGLGSQEMVPRHELIPAFSVQNGGVSYPALDADLQQRFLPAGAIMLYDGTTCPAGWSEKVEARGRHIVGLPSGGVVAGTNGAAALANQEDRQHQHNVTVSARSVTGSTSTTGNHKHVWATFWTGTNVWYSGDGTLLSPDTGGLHWSESHAILPQSGGSIAAVASRVFAGDQAYNTGWAGNHSHTVSGTAAAGATVADPVGGQSPTIQFLVCRKD